MTVFAPLPTRQNAQGQPFQGGVMDGVLWQPLGSQPGQADHFLQYANATPHDVTIISRDLNLLKFRYYAPFKILWCHDLALKRARPAISPALWDTDALYVLSPFQRRQYAEVYGVPESVLVTTRNGVDLPAFAPLRGLARDPHKLVYGSRPERGLDAALQVMERLAKAGSPLRLEVSGYNHDGLAPQMQGYYAQLAQRAQQLPNVVMRGELTQAQWHQQIATARALIYPGCPGDFREISCILAMEAQACGTPTVAIGKGAVPETLNGAGVIVGDETTEPHSPAHLDAFTEAVASLCADDVRWQALHRKCLENAPNLGWDGVAAQWEADWLARFAAATSDPERMRRHYTRIGDHEAAGEV